MSPEQSTEDADADASTRPYTIDGSRWLWVARWGPPLTLGIAVVGFLGVAALAGFQPFKPVESRLAGLLVGTYALTQWYQVGYILVRTERALRYDVRVMTFGLRHTESFFESDPYSVPGTDMAILRVAIGSVLAIPVTLLALTLFGF